MWQLTAVDIATPIAVVQLVIDDKTAVVAAAFLDHLKTLRKHGITLEGILSDNGPEFVGKAFKTRTADLGLHHRRIPPRSPNHDAACERFHGTVLGEFYRPHFHQGRVEDVALMNRSLQAWASTTTIIAPTTATTWPDEPRCRSNASSSAASARLLPDHPVNNPATVDLSPQPVLRKVSMASGSRLRR